MVAHTDNLVYALYHPRAMVDRPSHPPSSERDDGASRIAPAHAAVGAAENLQSRFVLLGKAATILMTIGLLIQVGGDLVAKHPERLIGPMYATTAVMILCPAILWAYAAHGKRSSRSLYVAEAIAFVVMAISLSLLGRFVNADFVADLLRPSTFEELPPFAASVVATISQCYSTLAMVMSGLLFLATRAAIIPSRVYHTVLLGVALGVPALLIHGFGSISLQADQMVQQASYGPGRTIMTSGLVIWWSVSTLVCALITGSIHRLRTEVRRARQLGQYTLEEKLGEGGMGVVYRGRHALMRRPTAIKLLPPDRAGSANLARFEREVQLTASLSHPNTITVFDYGRTPDGVFYYAMELLEGATLQQVVDSHGPMPPERVVHVLSAVADALCEAHEKGLIHRDIKPANVMLCLRGGVHDVPKVLDFGLVQVIDEAEANKSASGIRVVGTPQYMAPEALLHPELVDARSDLYALGAVGYFMLTGQPVFDGATVLDVCTRHVHAEPPAPSERTDLPIPAQLEQVILDCLEKDPAKRPASARQLRDRLLACKLTDRWNPDRAQQWWKSHPIKGCAA